jgi:hypothetical protein
VSTRLLASLSLAMLACGSSKQPTAEPAPVMRDAALTDAPAPDVALSDDDDPAPPDFVDSHAHDDDELACEDIVRDLATYPPPLADDAPERAWQLEIRAHVLTDDCEHMWSEENRECLATRTPAACAAQLPADIVTRLTKLGELARKIADARKKPATIGCKQAVAAHYADVRWKNRLEGYAAKARKQMIADSRKLMLAACTADQWSDSARACLVLGGGDLCFFRSPIRRVWGYPADGSVRMTGVVECDDYGAAVERLSKCPNMTHDVHESLVRTSDALKAQIAGLPAAERSRRASGCRAALKPISDMIATFGC